MPWHALHGCAHALTPICLKIPSNLLHMELTRTQVHKNMIFQTVLVRRLHVDVVQIRITVIKWLGNHLNVFKRSNDP